MGLKIFQKSYSFFFFSQILLFFGCSSQTDEVTDSVSSKESLTLKREASEGRHVFKDGSIYEGQLVMGEPNGFGKHELVDGNLYEGQHKNGLAHGHGTMRYKSVENLDQYVGSWKSGERHGFGTLVLSDGSRLVGTWKDDNMDIGEFINSNGVVMSGKWESEYLSEGFMLLEDGREYSGTFKEQGMFSIGSLRMVGGEHYSGRFENNEYNGQGILTGNDNSRYIGSFKNNTDLSFHRWTVDYLEDLRFVKKVYKEFNYRNHFKMNDVLKLLKKKPEIMKINYYIKKKQNLL